MKQFLLLVSSVLGTVLLLLACNKRNPPQEIPECPDCWDEKMICVEKFCECPEGYVETWLNLYSNAEKDDVPFEGRKFCIKPDKLTFMAHFPKFECIDTFAIRFLTEPLEVNDQTPVLSTSTVKPMVPEQWRWMPPGLILDTKDPKGVWVGIVGVYPTHGPRLNGCIDHELNGSVEGGIGSITFRGYFTHKDTISGHLLFEHAYGSKAALEDYQLEGIKLVRMVPY